MSELEVLREEYVRLGENVKINLREQEELLKRIRKVCNHNELTESFDLFEYNMMKICKVCNTMFY